MKTSILFVVFVVVLTILVSFPEESNAVVFVLSQGKIRTAGRFRGNGHRKRNMKRLAKRLRRKKKHQKQRSQKYREIRRWLRRFKKQRKWFKRLMRKGGDKKLKT